MVDLSELEAGDTVTLRNGKKFTVDSVSNDGSPVWPVGVGFGNGSCEFYNLDGSFLELENPQRNDIVAIKKKQKKNG